MYESEDVLSDVVDSLEKFSAHLELMTTALNEQIEIVGENNTFLKRIADLNRQYMDATADMCESLPKIINDAFLAYAGIVEKELAQMRVEIMELRDAGRD